ncbi:SRPBCC family protein [Nocardioides sp. URHA0020]|uniref:SRPBCC family protein n=1 Tax=Nocardioides sp. URHA0020 TaxID=1380392 RepID=UPI001E313A33|nr:SRPBCC family protein [Nocardioides sp. URHA0020]
MTQQHQTRIEAVADLPVIRIIREFEALPERVFRAFVDPELFAQWCGPRSIETRIERWDARTGGEWRYSAIRTGDDDFTMGFWGSFHEVRPSERIVQTWAYDGSPDHASLETMIFETLEGGRCRLTSTAVVESIELRDQMLASGMETGVREGYEQLDELLEDGR